MQATRAMRAMKPKTTGASSSMKAASTTTEQSRKNYSAKYRAKNKEKIRLHNAEYRAKNKEKLTAKKFRSYYWKNMNKRVLLEI